MSNFFETGSTSYFPILETPTSVNCAQEQEVRDLLEFLKLEYRKNLQYNVLLSILEEYIREDNTNHLPLKEKIRKIILRHRVSQTLPIESHSPANAQATLLGVQNINTVSLSYLEKNTVQEMLKMKLSEKKEVLHKNLNKFVKENLSNEIGYSASLQLSTEEKDLISTKKKLILEQEQYIHNLMEFQKMLLEISELRLKKLPDSIELKIKHFQTQEQINNLKTVFTKEKFRVEIFQETNGSLQAYRELIKDIKNQQNSYKKEIQELEELKEKYKQASCKQFDDILMSYQQYKSSLEQKKKLYNYLQT